MACTGHALAAGGLMLLVGDRRIGAEGPFKVGLNEVAVSVAKTAHYRPATLNGVRVKTWANLSIPFKL